ncbi:TonB-dependent receptor [Maribacter sp. MMG018]|uniref:TonB-dependent receptor plug domain-containing protein n=1 Tax=Maribacter sp. MMG018 TaxID=2822688 RepID=UPI001B394ADE|nr:TonB-dependent receptor [Maribacter sp. MMG018]MBQ4914388.1 TonB-dependent receptor [Maribacter sp. MMG018]
MNLNKVFVSVLLFVCAAVGFAQKYETSKDSILVQDLDEVVVTATRTIRQMSSLPLPVTLINKKQLQQTGVTRLDQILREQTGVILTPDATTGGGEGVQMQGIASDYILVLIDGVPMVGRSSGNLDLSRFAIGNVKQIEVVRGPSSSLFGSEALGGVINIITEKPTKEIFSGEVSHRIATFNNQNTNLSLSQRAKKFGYSIFVDRLSTNGYDLTPDQEGQTVDPFFNYTFNGRVYYDLDDKWKFFASGRYFFQEFDVASGASEEKDGNAQLKIDHKVSDKSNFQYELYYTNYITDESSVDADNGEILLENDFNQKLLRPEIRYNLAFKENNTLTIGGGYNFEILTRSLFSDKVTFDSQYLYAQYDFKPLENVNVIVGARFDHHSEYNSQFSPKISAKYDVTPSFAIKASVGSGFKAPDFRQLYLDFTNAVGGGYSVFGKEVEEQGIQRLEDNGEIATLQVSPNELGERLNAESSVGYNLGFVVKKGKVSSELNFFRNDFKNLIDTRILASKTNGQNVFGYINRESVYTQGLEVDIKYRPFQNLDLSAGYQLLYAYDKDKEAEIDNGNVYARDSETLQTVSVSRSDYFGLENRSRHTINFKVFKEIPAWNANANLRIVYRSKFGMADRNGNDILDTFDNSFVDGYALLNLTVAKTFHDHFQLQAGALNLLDYQGSNPLAASGTEVLINPGRQLFTKLNIKF